VSLSFLLVCLSLSIYLCSVSVSVSVSVEPEPGEDASEQERNLEPATIYSPLSFSFILVVLSSFEVTPYSSRTFRGNHPLARTPQQ